VSLFSEHCMAVFAGFSLDGFRAVDPCQFLICEIDYWTNLRKDHSKFREQEPVVIRYVLIRCVRPNRIAQDPHEAHLPHTRNTDFHSK